MNDPDDYTLTSSLATTAQTSGPMLGLTILWHPMRERVGEQYIAPADEAEITIGRFMPLFQRLGRPGIALGERRIAREPVRIRRSGDVLEVTAPASRMAVEVNGEPVAGSTILGIDDINEGVVLNLGGAVLLCLHWMHLLPRANTVPGMLGVSSAAIKMRNAIAQVATTDLPVLLLGETGTGKEVCAKAIHDASKRGGGPLVSVNMAALNESLAAADLFGAVKGAYTGSQYAREGLFAEAGDGSLFLDEIGNTPAAIQPMLLRVLETGEYRPLGARTSQISRARLIAATDQNLDSHSFNQPLLRRLEALVIHLPALRERREDIGLLMLHFLEEWERQSGETLEIPAALVGQLCNYHWPGNIRQLANLMRRIGIALQAGELPAFDTLVRSSDAGESSAQRSTRTTHAGSAHLPAASPQPEAPATPARKRVSDLTEQDVVRALDKCGWQIQAAARELGISRPTLYRLLEANPRVRRAEAIPLAEIIQVMQENAGEVEKAAAKLQTPSEALRRYLRASGQLV